MNTFSTLDAWLSHLESAHPISIDMGLKRVSIVKSALNIKFLCPVFTVGGTNGKSSTCAFLETISIYSGYSVGCYTSPHLLKFNERARLNGENVTDDELLQHFEIVESARLSFLSPISLTYFEFTTLAILNLFASHQLEVVILEVGLGGRFDAINIIDTDCAIITSIDIDHTNYLGNTRDEIAFEKAGIFRAGKPAICGDLSIPHKLIEHAEGLGADLWLIKRDFHSEMKLDRCEKWTYIGRDIRYPNLTYPALFGLNQIINASVALAALEALYDCLPISVQDINLGITNVKLPGRFQVLSGKPTVILDVAHNPHAVAALIHNLVNIGYFQYTHAVFGAMRDKDILGMMQLLKGEVDYWYVTNLPSTRAATAEQLETILRQIGLENRQDKRVTQFASGAEAFQSAIKNASNNDRIIVIGSFYTVSSVMSYLSKFRKN
ncbi:MAG: bifunctional tetrahydrofolate synthase/dihydrofolate synthase [Burkholderia sp.]|nr:bifunctional tetrahydrofolate synthase/dihydrofolate synthase [Burkholderia sp.]